MPVVARKQTAGDFQEGALARTSTARSTDIMMIRLIEADSVTRMKPAPGLDLAATGTATAVRPLPDADLEQPCQ
jgi:hypothetical protein